MSGSTAAGVTTGTGTALAQARVARLAAQGAVHRAFGWLHLHQPQIARWHRELLAIPAPPFGEATRAAWFVERFAALGLTATHLDEEGNAVGELACAEPRAEGPVLLVSAHLDTIFPEGTPLPIREDGARIYAPGACDNGAGLSGLLAVVAALRFAAIVPAATILFAANVGEEGPGDLRGMRSLFERSPYRDRIVGAIALEGAGTAAAITRGLGSRRFRVTVSGPGGHSWADAGLPNPILLLSRALVMLAARADARMTDHDDERTIFSPGVIVGGTAVNAIPETASVELDLRSTDAGRLAAEVLELHRTFEQVVAYANSGGGLRTASAVSPQPARLHIEATGSRPAAALPADSALLQTLRAVDRHLGLRTEERLGSTDANLPLALAIPAAALPAGGTGGGIHTLGEWFDPTGRETALRRILLTVLDLAGQAAAERGPG